MKSIASGYLPLLVITLAGCGNNSAPAPDPGPVIVERAVDFADYVSSSLRYVQQYSEGYIAPSTPDVSYFDSMVTDLLNQQLNTVAAASGSINFELVRFVDTGANSNELYCLEEIILRGQGFYCVDFDSANTHHISVPHPLHDNNTNGESVAIMRGTDARFLSISTTHRCSNAATSSCSGVTTVCGASGPYKVSDAAHNTDSFFYRFGAIVHDSSATSYTMQLHGCGSAACPSNFDNSDIVARLSAGTTNDLPSTELVNLLNSKLNDNLTPLFLGSSLSCNEPSADKQLCGTANTLGRYINGQADPCQNAAVSFTGSRWLHIEQNGNLRRDDGAGDAVTPNTLVIAINDSFDNR